MVCISTEQVFTVDHLLPIGNGHQRDCVLTIVSIRSGMQTIRKETRAPEPRKCKQDFVNFGNRGHFTILVHLFHFTDKETVLERTDHHTSSPCSQHNSYLLTPSMCWDEMVGWHCWLNGHEFEQAQGDGEGQGSLACLSPWDRKMSDTTERLNNRF